MVKFKYCFLIIGTNTCSATAALLVAGEKMQRFLEYYFNKPSSSDGAVPSESSEGTNTTKPVVLEIGPRKRPVGRPRKPSAKLATHQLVDYSSTDTEEEKPHSSYVLTRSENNVCILC